MDAKTTDLLHQTIGEAALPLLMSSDLEPVIKKLVRVNVNGAYVGCVYVDDLDQVFTLSSQILQTKTSFNSGSESPITTVSLSDFQTHTLKYLKQIGYPLNARSENSLKIYVNNINDDLLSGIKPLEDVYHQGANRNLRKAFPTLDSLKQGLKEAVDKLIQENIWSTNLRTSGSSLTSNDLSLKFLGLLSHYMFDYQNEQFFFTNTYTDWFVKLPKSQNSYNKSIFDTNSDAILKAEKYWSDPNPKNHHLADPIIASLILNYWTYLFEGHTFMRSDNAFKIIHADPNSLAVLPSDKTASIVSKSNTTDAKIILLS